MYNFKNIEKVLIVELNSFLILFKKKKRIDPTQAAKWKREMKAQKYVRFPSQIEKTKQGQFWNFEKQNPFFPKYP